MLDRIGGAAANAYDATRRGGVLHPGELVPNVESLRLETAPGGHLGVLTGGKARGTTWVLLDELVDASLHHEAA